MKSMIVLFSLAFSGLAYALVGSWTGVIFSFNQNAVELAVSSLAAKNDNAYVAAKKLDPKLVDSLRGSFQREFNIAANGFIRPNIFTEDDYLVAPGKKTPGLPDPRTVQDDDYGYGVTATENIFWKTYDLRDYAPLFYGAEWLLIPESIKADPRRNDIYWTYRYCEQNPQGDFCEKKVRAKELGQALVRRIVSEPIFVKEVCSSFATVLKKNVDWTNDFLSAKQMGKIVNLDAHFDLIDQTLAYLESGAWSVNKFDPRFSRWQKFLFRRYMDGGPQLMTAARECLQNVRVAMSGPSVPPSTSPDPATTGYIQHLLTFEAKPYPGNPRRSLDLQTKALDLSAVAHIFRQIPPHVNLPAINHTYAYDEEAYIQLGQVMSQLDPKYDYRLLTNEEYEGFLQKNNVITCAANKDYLNYGYEDLHISERGHDERDYGCRWERLTYVRIPKSSNNGFR